LQTSNLALEYIITSTAKNPCAFCQQNDKDKTNTEWISLLQDISHSLLIGVNRHLKINLLRGITMLKIITNGILVSSCDLKLILFTTVTKKVLPD